MQSLNPSHTSGASAVHHMTGNNAIPESQSWERDMSGTGTNTTHHISRTGIIQYLNPIMRRGQGLMLIAIPKLISIIYSIHGVLGVPITT